VESLNQLVLAGKVTALDVNNSDSNPVLRFTLTTNQMYVEGGEKRLDPEDHPVRLRNPRTLTKYIRPGKNVVITGRLKYSRGVAYVLADNVHFPGGDEVGH
jgi:single-stranded DNA-binding protein